MQKYKKESQNKFDLSQMEQSHYLNYFVRGWCADRSQGCLCFELCFCTRCWRLLKFSFFQKAQFIIKVERGCCCLSTSLNVLSSWVSETYLFFLSGCTVCFWLHHCGILVKFLKSQNVFKFEPPSKRSSLLCCSEMPACDWQVIKITTARQEEWTSCYKLFNLLIKDMQVHRIVPGSFRGLLCSQIFHVVIKQLTWTAASCLIWCTEEKLTETLSLEKV